MDLEVRLKRFTEEKQELQSEVQKLSQQLADIKNKGKRVNSTNGPVEDEDFEDAQSKWIYGLRTVALCIKSCWIPQEKPTKW